MSRLLTAEEIEREQPIIFEIFFKEKDPRAPGESLHNYFTRKEINCFCPGCRKTKADDT